MLTSGSRVSLIEPAAARYPFLFLDKDIKEITLSEENCIPHLLHWVLINDCGLIAHAIIPPLLFFRLILIY